MKSFEGIKYVYLLGIGGIGMSGLARYFNRMGMTVAGYDRTSTLLTNELELEGIDIHFDDDVEKIPGFVLNAKKEELLLIYTPAIPADHKEFRYFISNGYTINKRSQILGMITEGSMTVAVGGTHGKTTTTTLLAHIFRTAGYDMAAFLGGISANYNTNFLLGDKNTYVVVEADEFDRSFLTLHPDIAVITSVDADHLDIYGDSSSVASSYREFANRVKPGGNLIVNEKIAGEFGSKGKTYGVEVEADFRVKDVKPGPFSSNFCFESGKGSFEYELGIPGLHNVENAAAAISASELAGIDHKVIGEALKRFAGVKRRFEYQSKGRTIYIDDYAHHPEELNAFIGSVRKIFPGKKITGIFQPHLYSRTRDFAEGFIKALSALDEVILLDIYPAREVAIEGVTSSMLLEGITCKEKRLLSKTVLLDHIRHNKFEVLLTMGAGDIDLLVEPIKNILEAKQ